MMSKSEVICRHTLATRVLHWVNALCVFLVLMSGLQIFNAHPRLYWGKYGANTDRAVLDITQRYKHAKYVMGIEAVQHLGHIGGGKGGFWEDRGYEWYAGV